MPNLKCMGLLLHFYCYVRKENGFHASNCKKPGADVHTRVVSI